MKVFIKILLFCFATGVYICSNGTLVYSDTYVSGNITADTVWRKSDSPYIVTATVQVFQNITLTIEPGVIIKFNPSTGLTIGGKLVAIGTAEAPITFTSNAPTPASKDWGRIKFVDTAQDASFDSAGNYSDGCIIKNCLIEFGKGIWCENSSPLISSNYIRKTSDYGGIFFGGASDKVKIVYNTLEENGFPIYLNGTFASLEILNNKVRRNYDGLLIETCPAGTLIKDNIIEYNGANNVGGISVRSGSGSIISNFISHNQDTSWNAAIYCENVTFTIHNNQILSNHNQAIASNNSYLTVTNNQIVGNKGYAVWIEGNHVPGTIRFNDLVNLGDFEIFRFDSNGGSVDATNNWWGTTDLGTIEQRVFDYYDDITKVKVIFSPIATASFFPSYVVAYVAANGICGGKYPCFSSIQNGVDSAGCFGTGTIYITQETYDENVILSSPKVLLFKGGWDSTFTAIQSNTTINGSLTISNGSLILDAGGLIVE